MTDYISQTDTNKLIRKVLRESFPGVKFSVRTRGGSTNINWTDGPNANQIERLVSAFEGSYFDGMIDYKGSRFAMLDGKEVHFLADFIFCNRKDSEQAKSRAVLHMVDKYEHQFDYLKDTKISQIIDDWQMGRLYDKFPRGGDWSMDNSLQCELNGASGKFTFSPFPQHSKTLDRVRFSGDDGYGMGTVGRNGSGTALGYPRSA